MQDGENDSEFLRKASWQLPFSSGGSKVGFKPPPRLNVFTHNLAKQMIKRNRKQDEKNQFLV